MKKKNQKYYQYLLLIVITFIVFSQVIKHDFVNYDDNFHVYNNPDMNPVTSSSYKHFWQKPHDFALAYTVWAIQAKFARVYSKDGTRIKLNPHIFHITNLILHILSVLIVFLILKTLIKKDWAAFGGAMLFALHPIQVDPVTWITGLKDVLCGLLSLTAIWQYILFSNQKNHTGIKQLLNKKRAHYILATAAFILSMTAKPTAVVVPIIAWILDYYILRRPLKHSLKALTGWIILSIPMMILATMEQPDERLKFIPLIWERILIIGDTITFYLYKLIFPISMAPDYGHSPESVLKHGWIFFTSFIPFVLAVFLWIFRKKIPWLIASAGIFVAGILPVSGIITFHFQRISTTADRYLYLSMLGPCLICGWILAKYRKKLLTIIYSLILIFFGILSIKHTKYWKDTTTLYMHALKVNPDSWLSHNNLAAVLQNNGKSEEAIAHYTKAVKINPDYDEAHKNLGIILAKQGRFAEAVVHYLNALKINQNYVEAHYNLGIAFEKQGKFQKAVTHYIEAIKIKPNHIKAIINIGTIFEKSGKYNEALKYYFQALKISPYSAQIHFNIGNVMFIQKNFNEAINYYNKALKIKPDYVEVYNNLGFVLESHGRLEEAIKHYSIAVRLRPNYADAQSNLHRALQKQKRLKSR